MRFQMSVQARVVCRVVGLERRRCALGCVLPIGGGLPGSARGYAKVCSHYRTIVQLGRGSSSRIRVRSAEG
jgi:hypothetical protein